MDPNPLSSSNSANGDALSSTMQFSRTVLGLGVKSQQCLMQLRSTSFRSTHPTSVWCPDYFHSYTLGYSFPVWISSTVFLSYLCVYSFLISGFHSVTLVDRYHFIIYLRTGKSTGFWSEPCCPGEPRPHLIATGDFSLMMAVEFEAAINSEPSATIISCRGFDHGRLVPSIFHLLGPTCHHKGKLVSKQVPAKPRGI